MFRNTGANAFAKNQMRLAYEDKRDLYCTWRCHSAPADIPPADIRPGLVQNPTMDITRTNMKNDEYPEKFGREECIDRNLHPPFICFKHQLGWENGDMQNYDNMAIAELYPNTMDYLQTEEVDCLSQAVCYDSAALMPLIRINRVLFSDGDDTANRTEYDRDYDGSPAGLLGYLPWRL